MHTGISSLVKNYAMKWVLQHTGGNFKQINKMAVTVSQIFYGFNYYDWLIIIIIHLDLCDSMAVLN